MKSNKDNKNSSIHDVYNEFDKYCEEIRMNFSEVDSLTSSFPLPSSKIESKNIPKREISKVCIIEDEKKEVNCCSSSYCGII